MPQLKSLESLKDNPKNIVTSTYLEALKVFEVATKSNLSCVVLPDFRVNEGDDLRSYKNELFELNTALFKYYKTQSILITPEYTILQPLPKKEYFKSFTLEFAETINLDELKKRFLSWGYEFVTIIQEKGEVSFRENIIDVFPINSTNPFRIYLLDKEIEMIKSFDEYTQKSIKEIDEIEIIPAIAGLSYEEYIEINNKIIDSKFDVFYKDFYSLSYWFIEKELLPSKNFYNLDEFDLNLENIVIQKKRKKPIFLLDDLKKGDFVVHQTHGIGKFNGLKQIEVLGKKSEFAEVLYQNDDKLLLPIENLDLIDRYIAIGGVLPTLDKMGKTSFSKNKEKIRENIYAIAMDIIKTSAKRETIQPKPMKFDGVEEFINKAGFSYTIDQQKAVNEMIDEMKNRVMDRLLSGDVGFGKTEIAMVASYIAVKSGYQSSIVAPTTILVSQHYETFIKRFKDYNFKIAKLDRFTTAKQKKEIENSLKSGDIDIIISTHSAFNLEYKNLGIVVIDEEHKFGVKQKEKLKNMVENTHLLSMSATPIPRSLNLALSKIKGFSALNTPPTNKQETRTFVKEYSDELLREIISRELRRGGQLFYIYNNIASIELKKDKIQTLLPNLRILTLHAKLTPNQIEKSMIDFVDKKYDLLIATTIIESGIHIPNVNSVIVENADRFGIADLHQIRGRVGRGKNEGYAYFIVKDKEKISDDAKKRLLALEENSFLGSGAVLALHDLEIRGGGNIIGMAQSGQIKNVGYSMYIKMLEDALNSLSGEKNEDKETEIKLNINAFISPEIIEDDRVRIEIYRRVSKIKSLEKLSEIEEELFDRFGKMDKFTKNFFEKIKIKIIASKKGIISISNYGENITIMSEVDKKFIKAKAKDDDIILETILEGLK